MNGATRRGFLGHAAAAAGAVAAPTRAVARSSPRFTDVAISTGDVILAARTIGRGEPIVMHPSLAREGLDLHAYARDMLAVVDHFELERAHVFGHAYGNRVARTFATDHPRRSATVIPCACGGGIPTPEVVRGLSQVTDPETSAAEIRRVTKRVFFAPGNDPSPWYLGWYAAAGRAAGAASPSATSTTPAMR